MQTRRCLMKDSHSHHSINRRKSQRKNLSASFNATNASVNKDIVKIKNLCEFNNRKNQMNLKSVRKIKDVNIKELLPSKTISVDEMAFDMLSIEKIVGVNNDEEDIQKESADSFVIHPPKELAAVNLLTNKKEESMEPWNGDTNFPIKDLQSLLINMAITSYQYENTEQIINSETIENDVNMENDNIFSVPTSTGTIDEDQLDFLSVKHIRIGTKRMIYLAEKYVKRWKEFITNKKIAEAEQRKSALENFFSKLEKKKNDNQDNEYSNKTKSYARDYNNYQHRYKVQKHIIALQKAKLEEQHRIIDELKYNKIVEASKHSVEAMKDEVRKTYYDIDRHLKPKLKCMTNELKIPEIEEQTLVLQCLKMPQFLQRMEKRARQREEKHAVIRERRRQMEEERVRLKQQAEIAKAEMDREEKSKIIKELREKRKRDKIESIRKKQHAERMRALTVMADLHYERNVLMSLGLKPWRRLLEMKKDNIEKAKAHYRFQLLKNTFLHWMWHTEDMWFDRNYKAEQFYRKKMYEKCFDGFKKNYRGYVLLKQVADDYYDLYLVQLVFRKFRKAVEIIKLEQSMKWDKAVEYENNNLKFKVLTRWRTLPAINALIREQDARKARWRQKVLQVVPDYQPPQD